MPVFAGGRCTQGHRNGDDFFFQLELAVKMQLNVAFKLTLIYNGVMVCFGTQCLLLISKAMENQIAFN